MATETLPRVAALVPAAGASRRMGTDKRRLPLGESTVLEQTLMRLSAGGLTPLVVVLEEASPCRELLAEAIDGGEILVAENPAPERGMLSSIRCGLEVLPADVEAVAVHPGDHPFVPPAAVEALLALFARERPALLVPRYPDRRGHPLLIRRDLFAEASACDDTVGLRQLLQRRQADLRILELDHLGADEDLDTPEDYSRLRDG